MAKPILGNTYVSKPAKKGLEMPVSHTTSSSNEMRDQEELENLAAKVRLSYLLDR